MSRNDSPQGRGDGDGWKPDFDLVPGKKTPSVDSDAGSDKAKYIPRTPKSVSSGDKLFENRSSSDGLSSSPQGYSSMFTPNQMYGGEMDKAKMMMQGKMMFKDKQSGFNDKYKGMKGKTPFFGGPDMKGKMPSMIPMGTQDIQLPDVDFPFDNDVDQAVEYYKNSVENRVDYLEMLAYRLMLWQVFGWMWRSYDPGSTYRRWSRQTKEMMTRVRHESEVWGNKMHPIQFGQLPDFENEMGDGMGDDDKEAQVDQILEKNLQKPALRRLARRGGVKRISAGIYHSARKYTQIWLEKILEDVDTYAGHRGGKEDRRPIIKPIDIVRALKHNGRTIYGYGGTS